MRNENLIQPRARLGTVERALNALEILAATGDLRLVEVARRLDTSRATAFRILATLESRGFVEREASTHTYRLGPSLRYLAAHSREAAVVQLAHDAMAELRSETGETINLVLLEHGRLVFEAVLEGGYALRTLPRIGQTVAAHCSALGKAVLAFLPEKTQRIVVGAGPYSRLTERTITNPRALARELAVVRTRGFSFDEEETEVGLACVAAPIIGPGARAVGAVSVSGLSHRMSRESRARLGRRLKVLCGAISEKVQEAQMPIVGAGGLG